MSVLTLQLLELSIYCYWEENGSPVEHFMEFLPLERCDAESIYRYSTLVKWLKKKNMFHAIYGFAHSIECATQSRNSYSARHSIDWRAFYRTRNLSICAIYRMHATSVFIQCAPFYRTRERIEKVVTIKMIKKCSILVQITLVTEPRFIAMF